MIANNHVRQKVLEFLQKKFQDQQLTIEQWFNGRPTFVDFEEHTPAVAVFIDECMADSVSFCGMELSADLNIQIYLKSGNDAQAKLDKLAEFILQSLTGDEYILSVVDTLQFAKYSYDQDSQQVSWHTATMTFNVTYSVEVNNE